MSNISQKKETVNSMSQAPNIGRLLCRSKFELQQQQQQQQQQQLQQVQNHEARNCGIVGKIASVACILYKHPFYLFRQVNKIFFTEKFL